MAARASFVDFVDDSILNEDDHHAELLEAVCDVLYRWRNIAGALGLRPGQIGNIDAGNRGDLEKCMSDALLIWLRGAHNVERYGPSTWRSLVRAIENRAGGNNPALAKKLAKAHPIAANTSRSPPATTSMTTVSIETTLQQPQNSLLSVPHVIQRTIEKDGVTVSIDAYGLKLTRFTAHESTDRYTAIEFSFGTVKISSLQQTRILDSYPMNSGLHGVCVIINNQNFALHHERKGTQVDEENLTQCFRYLGYNVEIYRELTAHQIQSVFSHYSNDCDHTKYDSFVVCILSHGEDGQIFGTDSKSVQLKSIVDKLSTECVSLSGKPKLFFIQACRGADRSLGIELASDSGSQIPTHSTESVQIVSDNTPVSIPADADFFFGYATPPGNVSWRNTVHGSWYISEICKIFGELARCAELKSMVTKVHDEVGTGYKKGNYRQAPEMTSRLRKEVYFFR